MQKLSANTKISDISQNISSILDNCITIEKYTQKKYKQLSKQTENTRAKNLFKELSRGGEAHALMLTQIKHELKQTGEINNTMDASKIEIPKTEDIPDDPGVKQTYNAMKKHLYLERDFKKIYNKLFEEIMSPYAKEILRILVIDETNHHKKLRALIKAFEEIYKQIFEERLE